MTPRQLEAFVAVAQSLSFARACERLHMSQPALSLAIRSLEDSLGGRLLSRTTRQVKLTPEGAALLPQAIQLLADWDNVRERSRQQFTLRRGHVTIAAMPSFAGNVLPGILDEFRAHFPNIEVTVHDVIHEDVMRLVSTGRVELGFGFEPEAASQLSFHQLFIDRFVADRSKPIAVGRTALRVVGAIVDQQLHHAATTVHRQAAVGGIAGGQRHGVASRGRVSSTRDGRAVRRVGAGRQCRSCLVRTTNDGAGRAKRATDAAGDSQGGGTDDP